MTYYLRNGATFTVSSKQSIDISEELPVGTYTVKWDESRGIYYLEIIEDFTFKGTIYGDTTKVAERILNTFSEREAGTGVLLSGEKGSGKTLLAKLLSIEARKDGVPTIVINQPWHGEKFNGFIQQIEQDCVIIFDEFEKVYDYQKQEKILTLLDGVYPSRKLYVITCNDSYRIDTHMRNRPGRLFYAIAYKGLDTDFITEYCNDVLNDKSHIDAICRLSSLYTEFNFDVLKAMVEEMNRYDESPQQVIRLLNAKPEMSTHVAYDVDLVIKGLTIAPQHLADRVWRGNPLSQSIVIDYELPTDDEDDDYKKAHFAVTDLQGLDAASGSFRYVNTSGDHLVLKRQKVAAFDIEKLL